MDIIELECPHCGDELELDAAFAGSVCRCSTCGTLMTVPADPARGKSQKVVRQERPDAPPGGRPARPDAPSPRAESPSVRRPDAPAAPGATAPSASETLGEASTTILSPGYGATGRRAAPTPVEPDEVYVTDTGQTVRLMEAAVPTARKRRKVIRATVIGGFIVAVLAIVALIIVTVNVLFKEKPVTDDTGPKTVGIDPNKNPLSDPTPNLLGVPIGKEAAVVIDGTIHARRWYPKVSEIVAHHVTQAASGDYLFITWTDLAIKTYPSEKPDKIGTAKKTDLENFLNKVTPLGEASPVPSVQKALDVRADQIVLITGRSLSDAEINALVEAIQKRVDTRFDAVVIDTHDPALQKVAEANAGTYLSIPLEQFEKWYDQWKAPAK